MDDLHQFLPTLRAARQTLITVLRAAGASSWPSFARSSSRVEDAGIANGRRTADYGPGKRGLPGRCSDRYARAVRPASRRNDRLKYCSEPKPVCWEIASAVASVSRSNILARSVRERPVNTTPL
jgi:hypothetical protein